MAEPTAGRSVIHDIGYRGYDGPRAGNAAIARSLYATGLRHVFGLGRSGRSKVLPFLLLGMALLPAVILVGVVTMVPLSEPPVTYASLTSRLQMISSLFVAAQAPVLFSRDLRYRSIVLYLARPISSMGFAITRWASLATATLLFLALPTLVLYVGVLLAGYDVSDQTTGFLKALVLQMFLALLLAGVTGVIASVALRRGFAVVVSIIVLIIVTGIVVIVQFIAAEQGIATVGQAAGLLSPWTLFNGLGYAWGVGNAEAELTGLWPMLYVATGLLVSAGCVALLVRRFATVGSR